MLQSLLQKSFIVVDDDGLLLSFISYFQSFCFHRFCLFFILFFLHFHLSRSKKFSLVVVVDFECTKSYGYHCYRGSAKASQRINFVGSEPWQRKILSLFNRTLKLETDENLLMPVADNFNFYWLYIRHILFNDGYKRCWESVATFLWY